MYYVHVQSKQRRGHGVFMYEECALLTETPLSPTETDLETQQRQGRDHIFLGLSPLDYSIPHPNADLHNKKYCSAMPYSSSSRHATKSLYYGGL